MIAIEVGGLAGQRLQVKARRLAIGPFGTIEKALPGAGRTHAGAGVGVRAGRRGRGRRSRLPQALKLRRMCRGHGLEDSSMKIRLSILFLNQVDRSSRSPRSLSMLA